MTRAHFEPTSKETKSLAKLLEPNELRIGLIDPSAMVLLYLMRKKKGQASSREIASKTGLRRPEVRRVLDELLRRSLVVERHRAIKLITRGTAAERRMIANRLESAASREVNSSRRLSDIDASRIFSVRGEVDFTPGDFEFSPPLKKCYRGEKNHSAKLTEADVRIIRTVYAAKGITQPQLAAKYGVSGSTIQYIVTRKTWRHVHP